MRNVILGSIVLLGIAAAPAAADEQGRGHVGLYSGVVLPQISSHLGTTIGVELEGGFRVWRNLAPFVTVAYSQPSVDRTQSDPRIVAGSYTTSTTERELSVSVGALWWFRRPGEHWNVFAGLGGRIYLLETLTNGDAGGMPFGENREKSTEVGGLGEVGAELTLGPGALGLVVEAAGSKLDHLITGSVQTTALQIAAGYRLFF